VNSRSRRPRHVFGASHFRRPKPRVYAPLSVRVGGALGPNVLAGIMPKYCVAQYGKWIDEGETGDTRRYCPFDRRVARHSTGPLTAQIWAPTDSGCLSELPSTLKTIAGGPFSSRAYEGNLEAWQV
jgi:hypothetical protein